MNGRVPLVLARLWKAFVIGERFCKRQKASRNLFPKTKLEVVSNNSRYFSVSHPLSRQTNWSKPTPVGASFLDLFMFCRYCFHYEEMKPRNGDRLKDTMYLLQGYGFVTLWNRNKQFIQ